MNPNAIPSNTFSPGSETVSTGETGCPVFVPNLSPLVPQSTARPYDHGVTRMFDGSGPRVHSDTGAYSRASPVAQNKMQFEGKVVEQSVRYPSSLAQNPYHQPETPNRGRSNGFPVIPNISPGSVPSHTEHRSNHLQQYNTPNLSTTLNPNIKGREYAYQNVVAARSPQELRGNLDSTKFVSPQNPTEESYAKGSAFIHDVRIIQPAYSTPSDRRSELKSSANRPSIAYQNEERMNIPAQQHYVPNRSSGSNVTTEYANQNAGSLNYYQSKPSCVIQDNRTQNPLYPPDRFPNQLSPQNYNHNYLASKTGQLNLQDSKNILEYRNIVVPNTSIPGKYPPPYPILERRLEPQFGPEQTLHNYQYQRYGVMPNQLHTSKMTGPAAGLFAQNQKGLQNVQSLPSNYPQSRYYSQISTAHEGRIKDFDQNVHLNQLNQMHSRLPHSTLGRSSEMLQNLSYIEQNRHQRSRLYYESQAAMAQKSSKMVNYGLQDQRTPEAIHNEYLEMTRSCAAPIKPTDYPRVSNSAAKIDIAYDPKHSREYVAHQEYSMEHNFMNEQPSGYHNSQYGHRASAKAPEMPPRNISPRRTYQENMPIYVVSPPQASLPNPPSGAYGHPDPPTYPNVNSRNIHTSPIKSGQYPPSPTKYPNISSNRTIPSLRHFTGYQENYPIHQYYQSQHPNIPGYQDSLLRSQSHYPINLMAVPNASRSYPGFQNEEGIIDDDRLHYPNSQVVARSTEYNKKSTEMSKSIKEFLESWEDDEECIANLPDLVLCNNLPPEKHKHPTSSCSNSDLEDSVEKSDEKRKANEEAWYIYGRSVIAPEMLQQYLEAFPDKVVDSLPANIKGFYSPINSSSEGPSVADTNVLSTSSNENHDSPSPQDLSVNTNFITDEVLNLCTKEKETTEEHNNNSSPNAAQKSNNFDESLSKAKESYNSDNIQASEILFNQQGSSEKAVEKPVTASVIVPNAYFESNRIKPDLEPIKEISEHFDNHEQKTSNEEDQNDKKNSNNSNASCNENVTMIESQLIDLDEENLETQFDFDTELLSPEAKEDCTLIEDSKLISEKAIDISLENMLLDPVPIPAFDDTVSISEVLELDEEGQCASLNEENESDSIRSPSPKTTAKYDKCESSLKIIEANKEETSGVIDAARSSSEKLSSNYENALELHEDENDSSEVNIIHSLSPENVKHDESPVSADSAKLIEDSSSNSSSVGDRNSLSEKSIVGEEIEDDNINEELPQSSRTKENSEVSEENVTSNSVDVPEELKRSTNEENLEDLEENISFVESNEEKTLDFVNSPTADISKKLKTDAPEETAEVPKENISLSESNSEIISDFVSLPTTNVLKEIKSVTSSATILEHIAEENIPDSKEAVVTLTTKIIKDIQEGNTSLTGDFENTGITEEASVQKLADETEDTYSLENESIGSPEITEENENLEGTSPASDTYESCTTSSDHSETIPCEVEIPYDQIAIPSTDVVAENDLKDCNTELDLGRLQSNEGEIVIKDDKYGSTTPIILELLAKEDKQFKIIEAEVVKKKQVSTRNNINEDNVSSEEDLRDTITDSAKSRKTDSELDAFKVISALKTKAELKEIVSKNEIFNWNITLKEDDSNYSTDTVILEDPQMNVGTVEEPVSAEIKLESPNETEYENDVLTPSDEVEHKEESSLNPTDGNLSDSTEKLVEEIDQILNDSKTNSANQASKQLTTDVLVTDNESNKHKDDESFTIRAQTLPEDDARAYHFDPVMDSLDITIKEILNNNDTSGFIFNHPMLDHGESSNDEVDKCTFEDSEEDLDYSMFYDKDELFFRIKSTLDPIAEENISAEESNIKEATSFESQKLDGDENKILDSTSIVSVNRDKLREKVINNQENATIITEENVADITASFLHEPEEKVETVVTTNLFLEQLTNNDHHQDKTSIVFLENDEVTEPNYDNIKLKIDKKPKSHSKKHSLSKSAEEIAGEKTYRSDKIKKKKVRENTVSALDKPEERTENVFTTDPSLERLTTSTSFLERDEAAQQNIGNIKFKIIKKTKPQSAKSYRRNNIQKSKALEKNKSRKKRLVDCEGRERLSALSNDVCDSANRKLENHATEKKFQKIWDIPNISTKIKIDTPFLSECLKEEDLNVQKVAVNGQDEMKKCIVDSEPIRDEQVEKYLLNEVRCNKTKPVFDEENDLHKEIDNISLEKSLIGNDKETDDEYQHLVTLTDSFDCDDALVENSGIEVSDTLKQIDEKKPSDDNQNLVKSIEVQDTINENSPTVILGTISTETLENNPVKLAVQDVEKTEEISMLTLQVVDNNIDLYSSEDQIEVIIPNIIISDDMTSQNLSQQEDQIKLILPNVIISDDNTSQFLILSNENDSGIVVTDSCEDVEGEEIVDDYIGGEVVIGDDGIVNDWVSEEIVIDDTDNVQDIYTFSEKTEEVIEEQFEDLVKLNNNFIQEERSYCTKCLESKTDVAEEFDKEKELYINPENPVKFYSCCPPCDSPLTIKRRVSIAGVGSPKIEYKAPKRRYSEMEVVRSSKQLSFNLDEIKQTVTEALETITKRENMQYKCVIDSERSHNYRFKNTSKVTGNVHLEAMQSNVEDNNEIISEYDKSGTNYYSNVKQKSIDISKIDVPIALGNLDQVNMASKFASSYNQNNLHTNALKDNQLQMSKDLVNITNSSKSSTFNQLDSSVKSFNNSTKLLSSVIISPNSEPIVSSIEKKIEKPLLSITNKDPHKTLASHSPQELEKPLSNLVVDEQKKSLISYLVEAEEKYASSNKVKVVLPLINSITSQKPLPIPKMPNGCEDIRQQPEFFKIVEQAHEKFRKHSITLKFDKDDKKDEVKQTESIERVKLINGKKKCKINLEDYRNRKQKNCNGIKKEEIILKVTEEKDLQYNEKTFLLNKHALQINDEIEEPKKYVKETKITINNNNLTPNNLVSTNDSPNVNKPKRRKRRFRNLDASDEDEESVPDKEAKSSLELHCIGNAVPDCRSSKESLRNMWHEDSYSCKDNNVKSENGDNGEQKFREISSVDVNANGATTENNCRLKCHIKWKSIQNDPSIICDYKINKHKNRDISNLKMTLKPVRKEQIFSEVLSSLDSVVEQEVLGKKKPTSAHLIKSKWVVDSNNKVPKVIIKRNASGYCAVSRDVSSNPAWQPTISLKRQKFIEALLQKNKKIKQE